MRVHQWIRLLEPAIGHFVTYVAAQFHQIRHCRTQSNDRKNAMSGGQQAHIRIVELSQNAKSETVRADCNKWLAGVDNIAPVKKVEANHQQQIAFGGFEVVLDRSDDDNRDDPNDVTPLDGASLIIDDRHV